MNLLYVVCSVVGILLIIWAVVTVARAYNRTGTVAAAMKTVELLQAQVVSLTAQNAQQAREIASLTVTVQVLREQVTQAAPVRELAEKSETRHEENLQALTRIEGSLSRLESHVVLGDKFGNP